MHVAVKRAKSRRVLLHSNYRVSSPSRNSYTKLHKIPSISRAKRFQISHNMATDSSRFQDNAEDDELDDILNSIVEGRDIDSGNNNQTQPRFQISASKTAGDGLGIDEEIIVTKKRIPIPKLDDHRLLSDPGIPRLRKISKDRLRFKGKGHEVQQFDSFGASYLLIALL